MPFSDTENMSRLCTVRGGRPALQYNITNMKFELEIAMIFILNNDGRHLGNVSVAELKLSGSGSHW